MIDLHFFEKLIEDTGLEVGDTGTAYESYSEFLLSGEDSLSRFTKDTDTAYNWMEDSLVLREGIYNIPDEDLAGEYYEENIQLVHERILAAGVRLTKMLDDIVSGEPVSAEALELREKIESLR